MRQGRASRDNNDGRKVEPNSRAISPAAVSQIGTMLGNHATESGRNLRGASKPLYAGRGYDYKAPAYVNKEVYKGGSQGRR